MRTLLVLALVCGPLMADTIAVGSNDGPAGANGFPFGTDGAGGGAITGYYDPDAPFQELYSATAFLGPITITGISFASAGGEGGTAGTYTGTFTLGLGTAGTSVSSPSATYSDNEGADFTTVFTGTVTESLTESDNFDLTFTFTTPFNYNPANGDLLLQVTLLTDVEYSGSYLYFDGNWDTFDGESCNSSPVSEVFNPTAESSSGNVATGCGLLTQFTYTTSSTTSPVPEPAAFGFLLTGAGLLIAFRNRRK